MQYAKAIVAVVGSAVTAALAIFPPGTTVYNLLTIVSAALTAAGVYLVPNRAAPAPVPPPKPGPPPVVKPAA